MTEHTMSSEEEYAARLITLLPGVFRLVFIESRCEEPDKQLTLPQYRVLYRLSLGEYRIGDLARRQEVSAPTMTVVVDGLARRGLVERTPSAGDRRSVMLHITSHGREVLEAARRCMVEKTTQILVQMTPEQRAELIDGMQAFWDVLASRPKTHRS
jgi:DNA-binding MarR family transcriptional regulator